MLLRASGTLYERLYLISLGATCRYAIVAEDGAITLSDPGTTAHVAALEERFSRLKLPFSRISRVILTHLDPDRIGGLALLRRKLPKLQVYGTAAMQHELSKKAFTESSYETDQALSAMFPASLPSEKIPYGEFAKALLIDKPLVETDSVQLDEDVALRSVSTPGHRTHSVAYLVVPHEFAIVDETFGYYQGRSLAAPGGDANLRDAVTSIKKFSHFHLSGIGFPYVGAITGALVKKHLESVIQNTDDLLTESRKALANGFSPDEVRQQIKGWFYTSTLRDPCLRASLEGTFNAVVKQLT
jgi:glyoxylase-like metal-dependent hydrolase (beta-lactamase superfamily II)